MDGDTDSGDDIVNDAVSMSEAGLSRSGSVASSLGILHSSKSRQSGSVASGSGHGSSTCRSVFGDLDSQEDRTVRSSSIDEENVTRVTLDEIEDGRDRMDRTQIEIGGDSDSGILS